MKFDDYYWHVRNEDKDIWTDTAYTFSFEQTPDYEKILNNVPISEIEKYLRKKKINNIENK